MVSVGYERGVECGLWVRVCVSRCVGSTVVRFSVVDVVWGVVGVVVVVVDVVVVVIIIIIIIIIIINIIIST